MMPRAQYNAAIRSAIGDVTDGLTTVTLPQLQRLLRDHIDLEPPSPPALSRMLGTIGWTRAPAAAGLIFIRPIAAVPELAS